MLDVCAFTLKQSIAGMQTSHLTSGSTEWLAAAPAVTGEVIVVEGGPRGSREGGAPITGACTATPETCNKLTVNLSLSLKENYISYRYFDITLKNIRNFNKIEFKLKLEMISITTVNGFGRNKQYKK